MKNRIVINLDQPAGAVRSGAAGSGAGVRRRRWPRVLAALLAICVAIVLIAAASVFFWWRNYQTTPAYSLALVVDAARRDDMVAFTSQLDDEQLAKNLVASVRDKASSRYGFALNQTLQSKIDGLIPTLLPQLKDRIHAEVIKEVKEFSAKAESKPFVFVALAISSIATITTEGDNARALIPDKKIEVGMRRDGDRWKVVDFKDDVLVQRVVDGMMKDLPAIGGVDLNIPLLKSSKPRRRNR
jgi:hypothetical protein